jgi:hypothetical protein
MHAHTAGMLKNSYNDIDSNKMLNMLLAYGVTTIRYCIELYPNTWIYTSLFYFLNIFHTSSTVPVNGNL